MEITEAIITDNREGPERSSYDVSKNGGHLKNAALPIAYQCSFWARNLGCLGILDFAE
jgi:hypothetical protein